MSYDAFFAAYKTCALWSSTDEEDEPLNDLRLELSDEAIESMSEDARDFYDTNVDDWRNHMDDEQAGHDFWLTRNHHGAGFWDRGLPADVSERLTKHSYEYGFCDLYVADGGLIYLQ